MQGNKQLSHLSPRICFSGKNMWNWNVERTAGSGRGRTGRQLSSGASIDDTDQSNPSRSRFPGDEPYRTLEN